MVYRVDSDYLIDSTIHLFNNKDLKTNVGSTTLLHLITQIILLSFLNNNMVFSPYPNYCKNPH